ncbi:unnamed protein product, partial [Ectocarpus fasciculatus]
GPGSYSPGESSSSTMPQYSSIASNYQDLLAEVLHEYTATDIGIAWFLLVVSGGFLVLMAVTMVLFIQKRNVFEIRARSAYLVILSGTCLMAAVGVIMLALAMVLVDIYPSAYSFYMASASFFILACAFSCYCSRTIRLAVLFNPRARNAVPWLASERNHVCACLILGVGYLGFPLYLMYDVGDGIYAELLFANVAEDVLWRVTMGFNVVMVALYPLVWKTDDIFNIARELRACIALSFLVTVAGRLAGTRLHQAADLWINERYMSFISVVFMFSLSLGAPVRQLFFNPLESSDPEVSNALARRKEHRAAIGKDSTKSTDLTEDGADSELSESILWTYEKVAAMPSVSAAFDEFARKALCQESILFLKDVTKFQGDGYDNHENDWGGGDGTEDSNNFDAFSQIVIRYIVDGAPEEVNISSQSKATIVNIYGAGQSAFYDLSLMKRRFVFTQLYAEIRFVLESNLMTRFVSTDGFKTALVEDRT